MIQKKVKKFKRQYFQHNRNKINESGKQYQKKSRKKDLIFILVCNLRSRTNQVVKSQNARKKINFWFY